MYVLPCCLVASAVYAVYEVLMTCWRHMVNTVARLMYVLCQGYFNIEMLFSFLICQVSVVEARMLVAR